MSYFDSRTLVFSRSKLVTLDQYAMAAMVLTEPR
jgi:hypothetical protein